MEADGALLLRANVRLADVLAVEKDGMEKELLLDSEYLIYLPGPHHLLMPKIYRVLMHLCFGMLSESQNRFFLILFMVQIWIIRATNFDVNHLIFY